MTKEYRATRKPFEPSVGLWYENQGGGKYGCVESYELHGEKIAWFLSAGGWFFKAHGVGIYEDGKIDWDYSTDGEWASLRG